MHWDVTLHRLDIRINIIKNMHTYVSNQYNILRVLCKVFATQICDIRRKIPQYHKTMTFVPLTSQYYVTKSFNIAIFAKS